MIGVVVVSHGRLAAEFVDAAIHVLGPQRALSAVCIGADDDMEEKRAEISAAVHAVDGGSGVVIATDMFGGTPSNLAFSLLQPGQVEVIAGISLPALVKLVDVRRRSGAKLDDAAAAAVEAGKKYINQGSILLAGAK